MTDEPLNGDMLRDLQRRTAELPREIEPPPEAWGAIEARIETESAARDVLPLVRRRVWHRPSFLAAAALLLVAATSITTAVVMNARMSTAVPRIAEARPPGLSSGEPQTLAEFTELENDYIGTANRLSALIESGEAQLAPETVAKLKENLRVIDAAILEARRALVEDPANKSLMEILATSYSQKVDLLRRTADMGRG